MSVKNVINRAVNIGENKALKEAKLLQQQNDEIIDLLNDLLKGQVAIWKVLKLLHAADSVVFDKVEKELNIKMNVEE